NLTKRFGQFTAVDDISFAVAEGSIFGFVGPNGAGKTTTLRILATLLPKTSGEVEIDGQSIFADPRRTRKLIGYMPDFFGVYDDLRVNEYLDFYGEAAGCLIGEVRKSIPALLELVGLSDQVNEFVNHLSRGMKQRLCLARTLIHEPRVLILDEPASGLDPRARIELRHILQELQRMGKTIIISSHILSELAQMCSHIGIINHGKLPICGPISEVLALIEGDALIEIGVLESVEQARLWLLEQQGIKNVSLNHKGTLEVVFSGGKEAQANLLKALSARFPVFYFNPAGNNLEELFMKITEEAPNENQPPVS
ncbi:MAG TPA: ABC transporter ATP-binding protein, partial [Firmicutes bacterium]|nr:ABC transporter ATP-binding protein [Bacillota bacterium]